jgi:capsular polysaccharide biosynthesis protein
MSTLRVNSAFLRKTVLFDDDWGNNASKLERFTLVREKLLAHVRVEAHPGVFILRRASGKARIMFNEIELAEYLRERRGFRILDVTRDDVPTMVAGCAGARIVIGVEGSNLAHGLMAMQTGGALVTLQPPDRFSGVLKRTTDMAGMDFAFVVGHAEPGGFRVDPVEVERTLDLLPQSSVSSQPAS